MRALSLLFVALLAVPAASAASTGHFTLDVEGDAAPVFRSDDAAATLTRNATGDLQWSITSTGDAQRLVGNVTVRGWDVQRAEQVLPVVDAFCFDRLPAALVESALFGARVANVSGTPAEVRITLAFPLRISGVPSLLNLSRDVTPPGFRVGLLQNVTDHAFYLETTTTEDARANLVLQRMDRAEDPIQNPTVTPARLQRFPVLGLRPDTPYAYHILFTDCAGNVADSGEYQMRTPRLADLPRPIVTARSPRANATLPAAVSEVGVDFTGPAPPDLDHVNVFVDKVPQRGNVDLEPGRVTVFLASPLGPGHHSVGVELTTADGGTTVERWEFDVQGRAPFPPVLLVLALGVAAALIRRK